MMNRLFSPEATIDLDDLPSGEGAQKGALPHRPLPAGASPLPKGPAINPPGPASRPLQTKGLAPLTVLLISALGGVGLVAGLSAMLLVRQWTGLQQSLSQERNLLLVERLRTLGPATTDTASPSSTTANPPAPVLDAAQPSPPPRIGPGGDLPPPPPEEAWMAQLSELPPTRGRAPLLRVPLSPRLTAPAPATPLARATQTTARARAAAEPRPSGPLPQLLGLVGAPGRAGSAIFQVGETSTNVNVGEPIGGSGWTLRAADAESALIERDTEVRRITIVAGG